MTDNMRFWHEQSLMLGDKIKRLLSKQLAADEGEPPQDDETLRNLLKLMNLFIQARDQAQRCAVDAAPYVHPKLAAITVDKEVERRITVVGGLPDNE